MFLFQNNFAKSVLFFSLPIPVDAEFQLLAASSNWLNPQKKNVSILQVTKKWKIKVFGKTILWAILGLHGKSVKNQ